MPPTKDINGTRFDCLARPTTDYARNYSAMYIAAKRYFSRIAIEHASQVLRGIMSPIILGLDE
jgi:hypothetical protein